MKILFTTHHLIKYSGTETYSLTLVKLLSQKKHQITIYSKYQSSDFKKYFKRNNITIVDNLDLIKNKKFDIIHAQHNINVIEVRHYFPNTPIVIVVHGIEPFLEQPTFHQLNISHYCAISDEIKKHLIKLGISPTKVSIVRNLFDNTAFFCKKPLNSKIKKVLVFSNYDHTKKDQLIQESCKKLNIELNFLGGKYGTKKYSQLNEVLNEYDIVFTVGRGVIETILAGRIPFVINENYTDGLVTPENFLKISKNNFSGRKLKIKTSQKYIINELKRYKTSNITNLQKITDTLFSSDKNLALLEKIYKKSIKNFRIGKFDKNINEYFYQIINTTRNYDKLSNEQIIEKYNTITSSKFYKLWPLYCKIKKIIFE